jgi:hypothetical protein
VTGAATVPATAALTKKQALNCHCADLAAWTKLADDAKQHPRIRQTLQHWQTDSDLAGIHDADAAAKLPAGEQERARISGPIWRRC